MDAQALFKARLTELASAAVSYGKTRYTRFLDPAEQRVAREIANKTGAQLLVFGGYDGCERAVCAFYDFEPPERFPVVCIRAEWDARYHTVGHRDLLGAEMALGLSRDLLGDIIPGTGEAFLIAHEEAERYLLSNFSEAGSCKLKLSLAPFEEIVPTSPKGRTMRVTVGSMRLDAVLAAAYDLSRAEAQELIRRELTKVNHAAETRCDRRIEAGDLLSLRGRGRVRVDALLGETKKGRVAAQLFLFEALREKYTAKG